jgi:hypothetical protein
MRTLLLACNLLAFLCLLSALPNTKDADFRIPKLPVIGSHHPRTSPVAQLELRGGGDYSPDPEEDDFANAQTMIQAAAVGDIVTLRTKLEAGVQVNSCDYDRCAIVACDASHSRESSFVFPCIH